MTTYMAYQFSASDTLEHNLEAHIKKHGAQTAYLNRDFFVSKFGNLSPVLVGDVKFCPMLMFTIMPNLVYVEMSDDKESITTIHNSGVLREGGEAEDVVAV